MSIRTRWITFDHASANITGVFRLVIQIQGHKQVIQQLRSVQIRLMIFGKRQTASRACCRLRKRVQSDLRHAQAVVESGIRRHINSPFEPVLGLLNVIQRQSDQPSQMQDITARRVLLQNVFDQPKSAFRLASVISLDGLVIAQLDIFKIRFHGNPDQQSTAVNVPQRSSDPEYGRWISITASMPICRRCMGRASKTGDFLGPFQRRRVSLKIQPDLEPSLNKRYPEIGRDRMPSENILPRKKPRSEKSQA